MPDRNTGRSEHRPDQLAGHLCPHQPVRLPREPVPCGKGRSGDRRDRVPVGDRRSQPRDCPGLGDPQRAGSAGGRAGGRAPHERIHREGAGRRHPDGRIAQAGGFRRGLADSVPRARRRQPRSDGFEHAASGRADPACRQAAGRYRHGAQRCARLRCLRRGSSWRRDRLGRCQPYRGSRQR
ncbi:hypothetical protein D3C80_1314690 [compost metagenome]